MIDVDFIKIMNKHVRNIVTYIDPQTVIYFNVKHTVQGYQHKNNHELKKITRNQSTQEAITAGTVHMYQQDIMGRNAIDYAFKKNAIICIKAFVDSLLQLPEEVQFRNCFDKALLLMIERSMDVKELVAS